MKSIDVIKRPLVTEKGMAQVNWCNAYSFEVDQRADKIQIKKAIEELFNVKVEAVRTMNGHDKKRRTRTGYGRKPAIKKAYVKLHKDHSIDFV